MPSFANELLISTCVLPLFCHVNKRLFLENLPQSKKFPTSTWVNMKYRQKACYTDGVIIGSDVKCENRVPTLNEISRLNDPVLSEVFASSGIKKQKVRADTDDHPQLPPMAGSGGQVQPPPVERPYGEVVVDHNQPLGPIPRERDPMSAAVDTGVNVLANGANALYHGATSVGQAFGSNPQAYEAPLFNAATQFLGKK